MKGRKYSREKQRKGKIYRRDKVRKGKGAKNLKKQVRLQSRRKKVTSKAAGGKLRRDMLEGRG